MSPVLLLLSAARCAGASRATSPVAPAPLPAIAAPDGSPPASAPTLQAEAAAGDAGPPTEGELTARASAILDRIASGDFEGARQWFDQTMRDRLSAERIRESWSRLQERFGTYRERRLFRQIRIDGHPVFEHDLVFAHGHAIARVVFDRADGRVAGLFFRASES